MPQVEVPEFECHGLSDAGRVREDNQDAIRLTPEDRALTAVYGHLWGIADGMGGYAHGGIASQMALDALYETFYADSKIDPLLRLKRGAQHGNFGVYQTAGRLGVGRMGTTLTAVHLAGRKLNIVHVGDSRAYLIREGQATCLTNDHTRVGELVRMKLLAPEKVRTHSQRSVLSKCLGLELFVQPDVFSLQVQEGDLIVLCTDGVWGHLDDHDFVNFAEREPRLEHYNRKLLEEALKQGSDDNLSLVSLRFKALPPHESPIESLSSLGAFFSRVFRR